MTADALLDTAGRGFRAAFGRAPTVDAAAPGRVNLLGAHVDYNDGFVLPVAIDRRIVAIGAPREDARVRLRSANLAGEVAFDLDALERTGDWGDVPKGIVWAHRDRGVTLGGFDAYFAGDVPVGGGVSSSAAMDVVTAALLQRLFGFTLPGPEVALLGQRAENEFVGVRCGIMDQFVSALGRRGHLLYLDCRSLAYEHVPLDLEAYRVVLFQSGVQRGLAGSGYNDRRAACERGVELLRGRYPDIVALRDVTPEMLEEAKLLLPDVVYKRCYHVVHEIARVQAGVAALRRGALQEFGEMMYASHAGSRDWYEVSVPELDVLVAAAQAAPGALGARVTGAGFGGCTVNLVEAARADACIAHVQKAFAARFGRTPEALVCRSADGAFAHAA